MSEGTTIWVDRETYNKLNILRAKLKAEKGKGRIDFNDVIKYLLERAGET